ncbi:hypothetical protein JL720_14330 [Aureococcus anophagefferens]|nr:hypothetical protein JL720_14330 [Aureococcus anophagefferens]
MASQVAATTPDAGAVYEQAVRAVMARWTLLRLAVDQGWCDGDGAAAANGLVDDLVALVSPSARKAPHVEDVEDLLFDGIESKFNSQAEDGSVEEIAKLVISPQRARGRRARNAAAIARATQAPALAQCVSQGEPEENVDSDDDMDDAPPRRRARSGGARSGASGSGGARAAGAEAAAGPLAVGQQGETPAEAHLAAAPSASPPRRVAAAMDTLAFEDIAPAVDTFCPPAPPDDANLEAASEQLGDLGLDDEPAPAWACKYCGIRDPSAVVRCVESDKWFCNSTGGTGARARRRRRGSAIEELWRAPDADFGDLDAPGALPEDDAQPVLLTYQDGYHYQNVLAPLVKLEADHDRRVREAQAREDVSVRWDRGLSKRHIAIFRWRGATPTRPTSPTSSVWPSATSSRSASTPAARQHGKPWEASGHALRRRRRDRAGAADVQCPTEVTECGFVVDFVWKGTSYDRMQNALKNLAVDDTSLSGYLYHRLLGHDVEPQVLKGGAAASSSRRAGVPGLPDLNHSQAAAVRSVVTQPLSLIQGPPGTGKTVTSAAIVWHLAKQGMGQVLVTAPSNIAVDQLTEKIHATGLKVVRLCAKSREAISTSVDHLTLHTMLRDIDTPEIAELRKLMRLKEDQGELAPADEKQFRKLRANTERVLLKAADVICTTCACAGDPRLGGSRFRQVLIDEATQATEPESLIPIVLGAKQLVLVGDHQQLGPVQYRSHPCLSEFPSAMFYEGTLQNGVSEGERVERELFRRSRRSALPSKDLEGEPRFPWPNPEAPMMFYVCAGAEEMSARTPFLNRPRRRSSAS